MPILGKTYYVTERKAWRSWLAKHHKAEPEIWLIYYKKDSGKPRIPYDDAVEEALCYGWIDSTVKSIDEKKYAQRFSPRRPTSVLSQPNKERIAKLLKQRKMTKAGLDAIAHAYDPLEAFVTPPDILKAIKSNKKAWENYQTLPDGYKRIRIAFIDSRRRHGNKQFEASLKNFIKKTAQNKRFGMGH